MPKKEEKKSCYSCLLLGLPFELTVAEAGAAEEGSLTNWGCGGGAVRAYGSLDDELSMSPATPAADDCALEGRKRSCF